eukprot:NODE_1616_length_1882_cov_76.741330_g1366_i0.p1 GENE.NODE_1616_length_1882_cov_76.741330_g1366_i0~~NODE_1616_length_1882_cov_76.741330_g1366_i0.p1  ORF type:complete len:580 (+),score=73.85 NODE_1616_length_1882_cov_76.741330_g1366_i0:33-1742(+)
MTQRVRVDEQSFILSSMLWLHFGAKTYAAQEHSILKEVDPLLSYISWIILPIISLGMLYWAKSEWEEFTNVRDAETDEDLSYVLSSDKELPPYVKEYWYELMMTTVILIVGNLFFITWISYSVFFIYSLLLLWVSWEVARPAVSEKKKEEHINKFKAFVLLVLLYLLYWVGNKSNEGENWMKITFASILWMISAMLFLVSCLPLMLYFVRLVPIRHSFVQERFIIYVNSDWNFLNLSLLPSFWYCVWIQLDSYRRTLNIVTLPDSDPSFRNFNMVAQELSYGNFAYAIFLSVALLNVGTFARYLPSIGTFVNTFVDTVLDTEVFAILLMHFMIVGIVGLVLHVSFQTRDPKFVSVFDSLVTARKMADNNELEDTKFPMYHTQVALLSFFVAVFCNMLGLNMAVAVVSSRYEKCLKSWKQNWSQTTLLRSYHNYRHQLFLSMNNNGYHRKLLARLPNGGIIVQKPKQRSYLDHDSSSKNIHDKFSYYRILVITNIKRLYIRVLVTIRKIRSTSLFQKPDYPLIQLSEDLKDVSMGSQISVSEDEMISMLVCSLLPVRPNLKNKGNDSEDD